MSTSIYEFNWQYGIQVIDWYSYNVTSQVCYVRLITLIEALLAYCVEKPLIIAAQSVTNSSKACTYQLHYSDVIMSLMASQITSLIIVYSTVYSGADQRKHQSSTSLAFVLGIHQWPVNSPQNSPHKGPVTQKMFRFWWRHHGFNKL